MSILNPVESIKLLRLSGMSQKTIAIAVGVSQPTVCRIERGTFQSTKFHTAVALDRLARRASDLYGKA